MHVSPCRYLYTHNYSISPLTVSTCKRCCVWHGTCPASILQRSVWCHLSAWQQHRASEHLGGRLLDVQVH